ncbi:hypothetical protein AAVH_14582 [Aphelenchoides avenae]|nr:hypothetical protein AAVH_14582 [Aphelenchus avenae]
MVVADLSKTGDNSDYLTMKPIHRAKPFKPSASEESDGVSMALLSNASERPPAPPQHRPKPSTTERSSQDTKLYDNPNEGDTLSNVTSNGLDE